MEEVEPIIRLAGKAFVEAVDQDKSAARSELRALYLCRQQVLRTRASHQSRITHLSKRETLSSKAAYEASLWLIKQLEAVEDQANKLLSILVEKHDMAFFADCTPGLSKHRMAMLLGGLNIRKAKTAGDFWKKCGLDPTQEHWVGKELRQCVWYISQDLLKFNPYYRSIYNERKIYEMVKNINGDYAELAKKMVAGEQFSKTTGAYKWVSGQCDPEKVRGLLYSQPSPHPNLCRAEKVKGLPMLPPIVIHERALRYMVKVFIAHFHYCWHVKKFNRPPVKPYALDLRRQRIEIPPQMLHIKAN